MNYVYLNEPKPRQLDEAWLLEVLHVSLGAAMPRQVTHHPDGSRQRKARRRAKELRAARSLKNQYVPLCDVDRTVYLTKYDAWDGRLMTEKTVVPDRVWNGRRVWNRHPSFYTIGGQA